MRYVTELLEKAIKYRTQKHNESRYIDWSPSCASSKVQIRLRFVNFEVQESVDVRSLVHTDVSSKTKLKVYH